MRILRGVVMYFEWLEPLLPRFFELMGILVNVEWTFDKIAALVGSVAGVLGAVISVWIRWRNTGRRRVERLLDFIKEEETRLESVDAELARLVQRPIPTRLKGSGVFPARKLGRLLRSKNWGVRFFAASSVEKSILNAQNQRNLSLKRAEYYLNEKFLAHILRGAIADSNRDYEEALDQFKQALEIKPDDLQALEYAGLQQVLNGNPDEAIAGLNEVTCTIPLAPGEALGAFSPAKWQKIKSREGEVRLDDLKYFVRMLALSHDQDDNLNMARAQRGIGFAFENLHAPGAQNEMGKAVRHLNLATEKFPNGAPSEEVARAYEQLGLATQNWGDHRLPMARRAFTEARRKYRSLGTLNGRWNDRRMTTNIRTINDKIQNGRGTSNGVTTNAADGSDEISSSSNA
jgi:tetratricopeptide (TPR) repeat protein